jgi:hypothetical protein
VPSGRPQRVVGSALLLGFTRFFGVTSVKLV